MSTARKCKTKYLAKSAAIYTAVTLGLILSVKVIFAQQQPRTIIVSPPSVELKEDPGNINEGTLKITNNSLTPLTFKAVVRDFVVDNPDGIPHILVDSSLSPKYSASSWMAVAPDSFTLQPGKTQAVTYYLQVPANARPGGHYAAVIYEPQEALGANGTGAGVETHIASLFYVHVNGNIVENATIKSFTANKLQEYGPVEIKSQIANYSDTDIRPQGEITVKNIFGQTSYTQKLEEHNIYPEAVRNFTNSLGNKIMFGPYTAELRATYGTNNNLTLYATTGFFILPWKIIAVALLAIIAVVLLIIFMRKRRKNGNAASAQTQAPQAPQASVMPQQ